MPLLLSHNNVLGVDDNAIARLIAAKVLNKMQPFSRIHAFSNGAEALDYLIQVAR